MSYSSRIRSFVPFLVLALLCTLLFATPAMAADIFVHPLLGSDVTGDGSVSDPYATLGTAIGTAAAGDTVWAAGGLYTENVTLTSDVDVIGAGDDDTTIDGGSAGSTVVAASVSGLTFEGFTVTGGAAGLGGGLYMTASSIDVRDCTFIGNTAGNGGGAYAANSSSVFEDCVMTMNSATSADGHGGAVYVNGSSDAFIECEFSENTGTRGGAFSVRGASSPEFIDCLIRDNDAGVGTGGGVYCSGPAVMPEFLDCTVSGNGATAGGGIYSTSAAMPIFRMCTITDNQSVNAGGGVSAPYSNPLFTECMITNNVGGEGGGVQMNGAAPQLIDCTIAGNTSTGAAGGGVRCWASSPTIEACTISNNTASNNGGGGVAAVSSSEPMIVNCEITGNTRAPAFGGAVLSVDSTPTILNSTISNNTGGGGGGVFATGSGAPTITNCILWGNGDDLDGCSATYSNIEDGDAGLGNISSDPLFVLASDFRLTASSPCIDVATDTVAPPLDKDDNVRPVDGDNDGLAVTDMGAYEYMGAVPNTIMMPDDGMWRSEPVTVTMVASDDGTVSATYYRLNGGAIATYTAEFQVSTAGTTTIDYWSVDTSGGVEPTNTAMVRLDFVDPSTSDDAPMGWLTAPVAVSLTASDDMSGVADTVWWTAGSPAPQPYDGPEIITKEGTTTVWYRSTDMAGNVEATQTLMVQIDYSDPTVTDDCPAGWQTVPFNVTIEATDSVSGIDSIDLAVTPPGGGTGLSTVTSDTAVVSISQDGTTTIQYVAHDVAGNTATGTCTAYLDASAPGILINADQNWSSVPVTVSIEASDTPSGLDEVVYWVDGVGPIPYMAPFEISDEGTHSIEAMATDHAGNTTVAVPVEVRIDYTPMVMSDDAPSGWQTTDTLVTVVFSDSASGVGSGTVRYDNPPDFASTQVNTFIPELSPFSLPELISWEGTTTLTYWGEDFVGNQTATSTVQILIDKTPPSTSVFHAMGWQSEDVTVTLVATDAHSGVDRTWYRLNGGIPRIYTGVFDVTNEGTTTVEYWSTDIAGNVEAHQTTTITVDYDPPTVTDDCPAEWQTAPFAVTITATDTVSGVQSISGTMTSPPPAGVSTDTIMSDVVTGPITDEGTTTIEYHATDYAGNTSVPGFCIARLDTVAPSTTPTYPMGWQTSDVTFSMSATDNASGVGTTYYRVDSGTIYTYSAPFVISKDGTTTVDYWSVDVAGNVETSDTAMVYIDHDAPTATDDCPDYWVDSFFDVMIEIEDDISGPESIDITITLPPPSGVMTMSVPSDVATIPITIDGTTTIEYTGTDVAGNTTAPQMCLALLDTTYPSIDVTASPDWSSTPVTVTIETSDTPSGVDEVWYRVDDGDAAEYTGPFYQGLEGVHEVLGAVSDMAGNVTTDTVMTYTDYTPPVTSDDATDTYVGFADFTLTATDTPGAGATASSGVAYTEWRVAGGAWTTGTAVHVAGIGDHIVEYRSVDNVGNTEEIRSVTFHTFVDGSYGVIRVWGDDRFETAVETARAAFDPAHDGTWPGVDHVILASGMGVLADPLPSAGLVWAYDSPLLLLNPSLPAPSVTNAIQEISASCATTVTLHVVGGLQALPQARIDEIEAAVAGPIVVDRLRTDGDRFDMASTIAERVSDEWESRNGTGTAPERVLLANGFDQNAFFDALALSAVSASEGYPILLLKKDEVPAATDASLTSINPTETIVAGGPVVVSNAVVSSLGAARWWGNDRYETAVDIAENAVARGWLERKLVGISASLPDALGDGGPLGRHDGVSLLTNAETLSPATKNWLETYQPEVEDCFVFGGTVAVSPEVKAQVEDALKW